MKDSVKKSEKEKFLREIEIAADRYGDDHIDIGVNRTEKIMYGYYHSSNNSFPVTGNYSAEIMTNKELDSFCRNSSMCWGEV